MGTGAGSIHITPLAIDPSTLDTQVALTGTLQSMGAKVLDHVDIVIGHGHITGAAARALGETRYPRASRVHIIHTDPQGVAAFKATPDSAGVVNRGLEKARLERDNCASAHVVCGVGPKLKKIAQYLLNEARVEGRRVSDPRDVIQLLPGGSGEEPLEPPLVSHVLTIGRLDDQTKGVDLFERVVQAANERLDEDIHWVLRGLSEETADAAQSRLLDVSRKSRVRPFTTNAADLLADFRNAAVVCMASREEGFGLVAFEATMFGIPVLVPSDSGLGLTLLERRPFDPAVIAQATGEEKLVEAWSAALLKVLKFQEAAFEEARDRRERLINPRPPAQACRWSTTAQLLLSQVATTRTS